MSALVSHTLSFHRLRLTFQAEDPLSFGNMAANTLRGAFGYALREAAAGEFQSIFSPGATAPHPSGLADLPRPFVFRSRHLDGVAIEAGQEFHFDVHLFPPLADTFTAAFRIMGQRGVGPERSRLLLRSGESHPHTLSLAPAPTAIEAITVDFLTPTELKSADQPASEPLFPILFARVRDRIATLASLYGPCPLEIDFRGMGERAAAIRMTASDLQRREVTRRSSRTGQRHSIGGFSGHAEYEGPLAEFVPWLQAAAFTGVGRQTTWGKGEIRVRVR